MGIASDILNAKNKAGGEYVKPGRGIAVVQKFYYGKKTKGTYMIVDFVVESATPFDGLGPCNPPGSTFSVVCGPMEDPTFKGDYAKSDAKDILAALPLDFSKLEDKDIEAASSDAQPLKGMAVKYSTYQHTKKDGEEITLPKFAKHVQTPEEIAARRAAV